MGDRQLPKFVGEAQTGCVSRETQDRLRLFAQLVRRWNVTLRLLSQTSEKHFWERHVADSLQLLPLLPPTARTAIDVGSGAGLPGLVLAIATDLEFTLVESDKRKAAFLREAARLTNTHVTIAAERLEHLTIRADLLTARAVARLPVLLAMVHPHLNAQGTCLFLKGRSVAAEIEESLAHWRFGVQRFPSKTDTAGAILRIEGLRPKQQAQRALDTESGSCC